jgi:hypothetical protein
MIIFTCIPLLIKNYNYSTKKFCDDFTPKAFYQSRILSIIPFQPKLIFRYTHSTGLINPSVYAAMCATVENVYSMRYRSQLDLFSNLTKIMVSPINKQYYDLGLNHNLFKILFGNIPIHRTDVFNLMAKNDFLTNKIHLFSDAKHYAPNTSLLHSQELYVLAKLSKFESVNQVISLPDDPRIFNDLIRDALILKQYQSNVRQCNFDALVSINPYYPFLQPLIKKRLPYQLKIENKDKNWVIPLDIKMGKIDELSHHNRVGHIFTQNGSQLLTVTTRPFDSKMYADGIIILLKRNRDIINLNLNYFTEDQRYSLERLDFLLNQLKLTNNLSQFNEIQNHLLNIQPILREYNIPFYPAVSTEIKEKVSNVQTSQNVDWDTNYGSFSSLQRKPILEALVSDFPSYGLKINKDKMSLTLPEIDDISTII